MTRSILANGLILEKTAVSSLSIYTGDITAKDGVRLSSFDTNSEETYKQVGNKKIYLKSIVNGEIQPNSIETETVISPTFKIVKLVEQTPSITVDKDGGYTEYSKAETTCTFETLN